MAGDVKFIRVRGKIVPIKPKQGGGTDKMRKRKGAKYDKESGYYLSKKQRKESKEAEKYNTKLSAVGQKVSKPFQDAGATLGAGLGVFSAVVGGGGTKSIVARGLGGAAAGFVGGYVASRGKARKAEQDWAKKQGKLKKGSSV